MARNKRKRKGAGATAGELSRVRAEMHGGYAIEESGIRRAVFWPSFDPKQELTRWDLETQWRFARYLYANFSEIKALVKAMVRATGVLMPNPRTTDREWNVLARAAFLRRVMNPRTYDRAGKLNWVTGQLWIERHAVKEGDNLTVLVRSKSGNAQAAFYAAPQIGNPPGAGENWVDGVKMGADGAAVAYCVRNYSGGDSVAVPAASAFLYGHDMEPEAARCGSELVTALDDASDVYETKQYTKTGLKAAAAFAFVETMPSGGKAAVLAENRRREAAGLPPIEPKGVEVAGSKVLVLEEGHKLETLHDSRPSNESRAFNKDLIRSLAYSVGLDPELVYYLADMSSASVRLSLGNLKEWRDLRIADRKPWASMQWRYFIADEMRHGRLRRCRDRHWGDVEWVNMPDKTIDRGREANAVISLTREGLADVDSYLLAAEGMTFLDLVERRAHALGEARVIAEAHGCTLEELFPGAVGSVPPSTRGAAHGESPYHEAGIDIEPESAPEDEGRGKHPGKDEE